MLSIGAVASGAGVTPRVVRYYDQHGLIASERTSGGQRRYPETAVERVQFIQQLIRAGLSTTTIRQMLPCVDTRVATEETLLRLETERDRIRARVQELTGMESRLSELIDAARDSAH